MANAGIKLELNGEGRWVCSGTEGCGALLNNWVQHLWWHENLELRLQQVSRAVGAGDREEVH